MHSSGCRSIEEERADAKYTISVSIVEIYNEMVHDLLADQSKTDPELQKGPAGFTIPDLTQTGVLGLNQGASKQPCIYLLSLHSF